MKEGGFQMARPSRMDRLWKRLGFRSVFIPAPEDEEAMAEGFAPGRIVVRVVSVFCWRDRLRLLLSGRLLTFVSVQTDEIVSIAKSEVKTGVLPPGKEMS